MKRKGFTLIELLAVIVIIAVIALITIPLIGRVIENSKKGALTASASGIIEAAEIYYSTKMMENPETKTFTCSSEGCISGEEKLDYKGQVSEGRVILYADGKVSICIEDGSYASLKLATQSEITTEEGSCNYDNEDYSIDATVSKTKYNELQEELNNGKKVIAEAVTNKGVTTSETATFEEMANNIQQIETGMNEQHVVDQLVEALTYSGYGFTNDMTFSDILSTFSSKYPERNFLFKDGVFGSGVTGFETTISGTGLNISKTIVLTSAGSSPINYCATFDEQIDFSNYSNIEVILSNFSVSSGTDGNFGIGYGSSNTTKYTNIASANKSGVFSSEKTYTVDISSLSGQYYVVFCVYGTSSALASITIQSVELIR